MLLKLTFDYPTTHISPTTEECYSYYYYAIFYTGFFSFYTEKTLSELKDSFIIRRDFNPKIQYKVYTLICIAPLIKEKKAIQAFRGQFLY